MARCQPTRMLRDEHQLILKVVGVLETILANASGPDDTDALDDIEQCVSFFRLFTDACHHGKEEDLLFGTLTEHGMPRDGGPIGVMLREHEMGRSLVATLAEAVGECREGESAAWSAVQRAGGDYVMLLRQHIMKEDHVLFDMADRLVPEPACERLCDAYDAVCARRFEGRSLEELEAMAADLLERHGEG